MVIGAPELRAEVLRALHKVTGGVPTLSTDETIAVASRRLTRRDVRFMHAAGEEDLELLNACLMMEHELREQAFYALERLLTYCQFGEGTLDERVIALPDRAFTRVVCDLYELGWLHDADEDEDEDED
jgi:hypothetical protein